MTIYWSEMDKLRDTHPTAYDELKNGAFAVQRSEKHAFAQVAVDQAIEQTMNRDTKTRGGSVGFSLRPRAVQRWIVTAHERAAIAQTYRQLTTMDDPASHGRGSGVTAIKRQEDAVDSVASFLKSLHNQLEGIYGLINIVSGALVSGAVNKDLLSAFEVGEGALKRFMEERLGEESTLDF